MSTGESEVRVTEWRLIDRLKEPSSYAALGTALGFMGITLPPGVVQAIPLIGSGICLLLGIILKEGK